MCPLHASRCDQRKKTTARHGATTSPAQRVKPDPCRNQSDRAVPIGEVGAVVCYKAPACITGSRLSPSFRNPRPLSSAPAHTAPALPR